jgi:hypothetical protein
VELKVDFKALSEVLKQQRNSALDDVAALTAAVRQLQEENAALKKPVPE